MKWRLLVMFLAASTSLMAQDEELELALSNGDIVTGFYVSPRDDGHILLENDSFNFYTFGFWLEYLVIGDVVYVDANAFFDNFVLIVHPDYHKNEMIAFSGGTFAHVLQGAFGFGTTLESSVYFDFVEVPEEPLIKVGGRVIDPFSCDQTNHGSAPHKITNGTAGSCHGSRGNDGNCRGSTFDNPFSVSCVTWTGANNEIQTKCTAKVMCSDGQGSVTSNITTGSYTAPEVSCQSWHPEDDTFAISGDGKGRIQCGNRLFEIDCNQ